MSVFVTGTGTEVGKTIVAAAIARTLAASGRTVSVFKPVVTGLDDLAPGQAADHELLRAAASTSRDDDQVTPYRFGPAMSPHLAAEIAGEAIDATGLLDAARDAASAADELVCEGVGGLLVPLTRGYLVRDFARDLGLPLAIAAHPGLGTINHTLLTIEAARAVGLEITAVVLTPWPEHPDHLEADNRETIAQLGRVRVLALPWIDLSDPNSWPALEV